MVPKNSAHTQGGMEGKEAEGGGGAAAVNCNIHHAHLTESLSSVSSHFTPDLLIFSHVATSFFLFL